MKNRTIITLLTWNRLNITKQTLSSFHKHNNKHDILVIDNGSEDGSPEWLSANGYNVIRNQTNEGIFAATKTVWFDALIRGYDFILNLQNDFPCVRTIPFQTIEKYLDSSTDVGFVLLNDKSKVVKYKSDGRIVNKQNDNRKNKITDKKIVYQKWTELDGTKFRKGNHHFTFNPSIFSVNLVSNLVGSTDKPRERGLMENFHRTKLLSAHLDKICFETILRPRNDGWIH